jgi:ABC-type branched-subunit amino acid transport system substrate-binding protein
MIVNDKVHIIGGGITPTVLAYGQLVSQAKIATVVMISGASVTTNGSPYFVRTSFILAQSSWIMGEWAAKNGSKRVVTLVNEWAPGTEAETAFKQRFTELGGQIVESIRIPLAVSATHPRHQSRHGFHLFPGHASRHLRQAIRRAGSRQFRDQDHRARRSHRR